METRTTKVFIDNNGNLLTFIKPKSDFWKLVNEGFIKPKDKAWTFEVNGNRAKLLELGFRVFLSYEIDYKSDAQIIPAKASMNPIEKQSSSKVDSTSNISKKVKAVKPKKKAHKDISIIKELTFAYKIIDKKNSIPVLENFCIKKVNNQTILAVTDLEQAYTTPINIQTGEGLSITVSAKKLIEILKQCDNPVINKVGDTNWITIQDGNKEYKIVGIPSEEYPELPQIENDDTIQIDANELKEALKKVTFACTQEDSRFALNGGLFLFKDGKLRIITTDAHRMCLRDGISIKTDKDVELQKIIPKATLLRLIDFINLYRPEYIEFSYSENHVQFKYQDKIIISRHIDGQYPNYEKILPSDHDKTLKVNVGEFKGAVLSAALISNKRSNGIRIHISKDKLVVSANNPELGESGINISEFSYVGKPIVIGFQANYLLDFLNKLDKKDMVWITFKKPEDQAKLTPAESNNYVYVVMPLRLSDD